MTVAKDAKACDGCGTRNRVLTQIESGQSICRQCLRVLRPPGPSREQLIKADHLGLLAPPDGLTRDDFATLLARFDYVKRYTYDLWEELAGLRPYDSGVPKLTMWRIIHEIAIESPKKADRIIDIQKDRERKTDEAIDAVMKHFRTLPAGVLGVSPVYRAFKAQIPRDDLYDFVSAALRANCGDYIGRSRAPRKW
jgi:hypothetical protein